MPSCICKGLFPQKSPIIGGSFAGKDLQFKASYFGARQRPIECLTYLDGSFSSKSPVISGSFAVISGSFAKRDLQLQASYSCARQRPIECLHVSLQVIFRKRALHLGALLRKGTCNLRHPIFGIFCIWTYSAICLAYSMALLDIFVWLIWQI